MEIKSDRAPVKVEFAVFLLHWVVVVAVCVSAVTGWRIAVDDSYSAIGQFVASIAALLPLGSVHTWHAASGFAITIAATAYLLLIVFTGALRRITDPVGLRRQVAASGSFAAFVSSRVTWRIVRVRTYQFAFVLIAVMAATGWMLYFDAPFGGRRLLANVHGLCSVLFIAYICVHTAVQFKAGILKSIFLPKAGKLRVGLCVLGACVFAYGLVYATRGSLVKSLHVLEAQQAPLLDGKGDDPVWRDARPITLQAFRGENSAKNRVDIEVRAARDAENIYFLFRWTDPTLSREYMPLIKEEGGWKVLQSGYDVNDENGFYEDKFAVLFSQQPRLGSGTAHLGPGMRPGQHRSVTRGLHYTDDGSVVDVWHWKATRTAPMRPGMMDDNHFGPPLKPKEGARYTGGYTQDPHTAGGYSLNWEKVDPDAPLSGGYVLPRFLPTDPTVAAAATRAHAEDGVEDGPYWHMYKADSVPYAPALDTYETGTVLPGVLIDSAFVGDRGDILAEAHWENGAWTLEVSRKLRTGSTYDADFTAGQGMYFWVATFDNSQIRHSYHMQPARLVFGR